MKAAPPAAPAEGAAFASHQSSHQATVRNLIYERKMRESEAHLESFATDSERPGRRAGSFQTRWKRPLKSNGNPAATRSTRRFKPSRNAI